MNIIVEGSRGKSGTVETVVATLNELGYPTIGKVTGKCPEIILQDKKEKIERIGGKFLIDQENKPILKKYENMRFRIFENQALSCYTMRAVHNLIKPEIILIPNIRFEHQDLLGPTIEEQALSFAVNFSGAKTIITTETKENVLNIFREYAYSEGAKLIEINRREKVPSIQYLRLTEALVKELFGIELPLDIRRKIIGAIIQKTKVKYSGSVGLYYFKGSKVNDTESTENMFNFIKKITSKDFCFVCYLRKDRSERTEAFIPLFKAWPLNDRVKKIFVIGHTINIPLSQKTEILPESEETKQHIYEYCRKNNLVLFTAINGVTDFMKQLEAELGGEVEIKCQN